MLNRYLLNSSKCNSSYRWMDVYMHFLCIFNTLYKIDKMGHVVALSNERA